MPTYEYVCKSCGERFEKAQSFSARPLKTHAACGGDVQKIFHASGVVFKGPGFYATDSRPARTANESDGSSMTTSDAAKSDTAPAKAADKPKKETAGTKKKESAAAAAAD
ncbi:MAG TPA: FmdB family zinc ribbon protein [Acidimicrobiia bacterium]|nr:FmdB family zinc ribbon protein [Acidimicrobiia bacterium]